VRAFDQDGDGSHRISPSRTFNAQPPVPGRRVPGTPDPPSGTSWRWR
jgi:hypothetical protein